MNDEKNVINLLASDLLLIASIFAIFKGTFKYIYFFEYLEKFDLKKSDDFCNKNLLSDMVYPN